MSDFSSAATLIMLCFLLIFLGSFVTFLSFLDERHRQQIRQHVTIHHRHSHHLIIPHSTREVGQKLLLYFVAKQWRTDKLVEEKGEIHYWLTMNRFSLLFVYFVIEPMGNNTKLSWGIYPKAQFVSGLISHRLLWESEVNIGHELKLYLA